MAAKPTPKPPAKGELRQGPNPKKMAKAPISNSNGKGISAEVRRFQADVRKKPSAKKVADSTTRGFAGSWAQSNTQKGKGR